MSEKEKGIEKPNKIADIVEKVLGSNKSYYEGQGLKIITPNQMLSGLPINLAQLNAGNKSEKI